MQLTDKQYYEMSYEVLDVSKEAKTISEIAKKYGFSNVKEMNAYAKKRGGYIYQEKLETFVDCMVRNEDEICPEAIKFSSRNDFISDLHRRKHLLCVKHKSYVECEACGELYDRLNHSDCPSCERDYQEYQQFYEGNRLAEWEAKSDQLWVEAQPKLRWFHYKLFQNWFKDGLNNFEQVCDVAGIKKSMQNHILKDLKEWGLLFESINGLFLIKNAKTIDKPVAAMKSVFDSPRERQVYVTLVSEHPTKLILPNQALSSFIDFQLIKQALTKEESDYFFKARVDFLLVHPFNLYPLLAIEIDSTYHNTDEAVNRDGMKDRILELAQVPFQRMYRTEEK